MNSSQLGFDGGNLSVAELFSSMPQMLPERQNRLIVADVRSVPVNDFRTNIKVFSTPQRKAVPRAKRFLQ